MLSRINDPQSTNQLKTQSLAALPIPIGSSPNLNQQDVWIYDPIRIFFDKPILRGTGHFIISNGKGDTRSISALDGNQVVFSNDQKNTLVINPYKNLLPDSQYSVQMEPGALTDTDGNPLAGVTNSNALNFTTLPIDTAPPVPLSTRPSDNAEQVDINLLVIEVEFNEPVKVGSGNIIISNGHGDTRKIAITDTSQVSIGFSNENHTGSVSIIPAMKLLNSSTYSVQIDKGAITDLAGNAFAGVSDTTSFNFTTRASTIDTQAPQLSADNPIVSLSPGSITLNFNEPIFLVSGSIALSDSQGNSRLISVNDQHQVSAAIGESKGAPSTSITISPQSELVAGSQYIVNLEGCVITDAAGNKLAGGAQNALKVTAATPANITPESTGPTVVSVTPDNNQTDVPVSSNIIVNFNKDILPTNGHFIISNDQGDLRVIAANDKSQVNYLTYQGLQPELSRLSINPTQDLLVNSHYSLRMEAGAVTDLAGNPVQANALNFTTSADTTPPIALSSSPANAAQQVALDSAITGLFNEPIFAGDGNITIVDTQNKTSIVIPAKDSSQVTFNYTNITVKPTQNFAVNHQYSVLVDANAISDFAGNFFPAVSDPNVLTFATNDNAAPKLIEYSNLYISQDGLPINSSITIFFNEALKLGKGNITLTDHHGDTRIIDINDPDQVNLNYNLVTIKPKQFLNFNDRYSVLIDTGVVTDLAGYAYAGLNDSTSIVFDTRAPNPPPKLSGFQLENKLLTMNDSIDSGTAHLVNSDIALRFDTKFKLGVGHVIISDGHNDTRSIDINDASQVTVVTNKGDPIEIRINPAADLLSNSHYFIQLEAGSVTDLVGTPIAAITDTNTIAFDTAGLVPAPAAMHPVQEINHGGVEGIYDNHDVLQLNFNQPVNWKFGGFILSQHDSGDYSQHDLGGNDIYLSADGLSATVELNHASRIVHGDILTLTGISDQWGHTVDVAFTL